MNLLYRKLHTICKNVEFDLKRMKELLAFLFLVDAQESEDKAGLAHSFLRIPFTITSNA